MHGQRVTGLGTLDVERPRLRIDEREVAHLGHPIVHAAYPPGERVLGEQLQDRAGFDARERGGTAERPDELRRIRTEAADDRIRHNAVPLSAASPNRAGHYSAWQLGRGSTMCTSL